MGLSLLEKGTEKIINLYAKYGTKSPNLCFAGHTDVVPAGDLASWSSNPFKAKIKKILFFYLSQDYSSV